MRTNLNHPRIHTSEPLSDTDFGDLAHVPWRMPSGEDISPAKARTKDWGDIGWRVSKIVLALSVPFVVGLVAGARGWVS